MTSEPRIEDYALLGNTHSAALVSRLGSIDWCCFPRFDSGACFAALVGTADNGRWSLHPVEPSEVERRYRSDTLVLETTHTTASGQVRVVDALVPGRPDHRLVRLVEGVSGAVEMTADLTIRFDYGWIVPWVTSSDDVLRATAGPEAISLRSPVALHGAGMETQGRFVVSAGQQVGFDLAWHPSIEAPPSPVDPADLVAQATTWWRDWSTLLRYDGPYRQEVEHSLRILKAMTYSPTGALVAAPTTSLPESLGGSRNWDYRYCWLRDSTMALLALIEGGCTSEAVAWRDWLVRAVAGDPSCLQIMYSVTGQRRLPEQELGWLPGFNGSQPVRVGNGAAGQRQLDVVGEVIDALHQARGAGIDIDENAWNIQLSLLDWLAANWNEPDQGIWEVRSGPANFTFSKVMCWVAFDRAIRAVEDFGAPGDADRWRQIRDQIHDDICRRAVDDHGRFVQSYEHHVLDAATLMIPLVGFLPADDPRVVATVEDVAEGLSVDGLIRRYQADDGLPGTEGAFLLCSFWLVDCYVLMNRHDEARALFERLLSIANDVGLLAEEYDPATGRLLGNFPQAFSHLALVSSAMMLSPSHRGPNQERAERGRTGRRTAPGQH